ncbi:type III secretion system export apparatus subunit SctS [Erwinia tracheiphila]|uniref:EscS/YscS/HrcS family type III secretion system export apparatus protein n=1 Tax=Erwinia tracheiphila TaxID=65700 RepID=A0A0M2KHC7_9GAMM|nr:type III secretion system export apparatus subunit SctS [Erwinia tracheiphila]AXF77636.1 EscS/YscS/HrcS family type III secretion system export apparatus protein [Erwinia tracheiphila]EOS94413.1 type III secretion system protein [Erwinia tracheiphila PSU-1]KKF36742.1 type III secretion system protein SpaQ [Erwinia tracheiphila]UIA83677.1 type III secretion system export apparatus subunit SctS [Erwinia tracheiphila]UIA88077.1 type III secretion system export apparatus subunit SctS [Erwinia t
MNNILFISNSALIIVLKLSAVPILFATIVGILVGLFQTVMQIQEQTLPFGLKMLAVFASIFMLIEWFSAEMMIFSIQAFQMAFK